jgi:hypothetical protein
MAKGLEAASLWLSWVTGLPRRSNWRRLPFQRALRENALDFAGVTLESTDLVMEEALRRLGEAGGFSLVLIDLPCFANGRTYRWSRNRTDRVKQNPVLNWEERSWLETRLMSAEPLVILDMARLPQGAIAERKTLMDAGAGSMVTIQIKKGDLKLGLLTMFSSQTLLDLPPFDQGLLRSCGELFSRTIYRLSNAEQARVKEDRPGNRD